MSGRKRTTISPSLFPFLAVLVCTLGTLILLLALVAQNATDNAQQQAQSAREKAKRDASEAIAGNAPAVKAERPRLSAATVAGMIDEENFRVQQLVAFRDKQTADLEDRRDQMGHLENHITRLRSDLERLNQEVERAFGDQPTEAVDDAVLISYRKRIEEESKTIEKLRGDSNDRTPRVVIVPHKGPNGTDRRPIYLECNENDLTIWPEGTRITLKQLIDSDASANPLDAALRVVRHHAMQTYGDTAPPYPLLVVRPDGIETYGAARNAMEDWDDQFGYELIPEDMKLAYSAPDANLKTQLESTIAKAVANQSASLMAARGFEGSGGGGGPRSRPRVLSAASLDRAGRSSGYHTTRGSEDFGSSTYGGSSSRSISATRNANTGSNNPGTGGYTGAGAYAETNPSGIDPQTEKQWADDMRSAAGELNAGGFGPTNIDGDSMGLMPAGTDMKSFGEAGGGQVGAGEAQLSESGSGKHGSGEPSSGEPSSGEPSSGEPKSNLAESGNVGTGETGLAQSNLAQPKAGQTSRSAGSASQAGSTQSQSAATSTMSSGTTGNGGDQSAGSASSATPTAAKSGGDAQQQQQAAPQVSMNMTPQKQLVRRNGRDWALPEEVAGSHGNAIVRTIRIQCYNDRFVMLAPGSGGATEMHGFSDGDVERATLELATSVRDRIDQWGAALPGGRWQPRLDVEVMPGGGTRFMQFRSLMDGSGVEVTGRESQ